MRAQRGMGAGQIGQRQLPRNAGLTGQPVGPCQPRGLTAQPARQGGPPAAQHLLQRRTLGPSGAAKPRGHQIGHVIGHLADILKAARLAGHGGRIDGMAAARQTP